MPAPDPRMLATLLLCSVIADGKEFEAAFAREAGLDALEPRDKAFVRQLVLTVLRHHGELGALLGKYITRLPKEAPLIACLQLGAAQLLYLDTPAHAAVDTSVRLAKTLGFVRQSGMVNAVLKKIAVDKPAALAAADPALNLTPWLRGRLRAQYGAAGLAAIARAQGNQPPLDLTAKADAEEWAATLGATRLPTGSLRLESGDVTALPGFDDGAWWVQDAAAALPVRLLGEVAGQRVLDACAAPGGKTLQLAAAGAAVTALDRSAPRLARLEDNLRRTGLTASIVCADALAYAPPEPFDAVLLDAPCTATGTMRRHPDIAIHRREADLLQMIALQAALLDRAAAWVKPGGRLVYSVCSLLREEGEAQAEAFLGRHPGWTPVATEVPGLPPEMRQADGSLRTLPSHWAEHGGLDGFYAMGWQAAS